MSDDVGARLRALRELRNISQRELARLSGVTHSSLSQIEQGRVSPSVSSLKKILDVIPISIGDFFTMDIERADQVFYQYDELPKRYSGDILYRLVGADRPARALSFLIETYPPGADTGREVAAHRGEETGLVLEGEIEVTVGGRTRHLGPMDTWYFDTNIPHRFRNTGNSPCRLISCCTPAQPNIYRSEAEEEGAPDSELKSD
ncbi:cupin domain-containing protein [Kushneria phosphatilytica]|uniref:Cupin domain-containing protein n=1 Tax=Kushneria phosphatilytica TaxID=657387 RepID=A0A5C1A1A2_9GAMM|nr:cupin domain-containing protein [Kushneria phosphatilytica]QEL11473.1 cupin domain-containing protein [Kushneria phosphatilytica]